MANRSIKVAPKKLTEFQKQKFLEVQRYMKDYGVSKSKAIKECKASPTTYYLIRRKDTMRSMVIWEKQPIPLRPQSKKENIPVERGLKSEPLVEKPEQITLL